MNNRQQQGRRRGRGRNPQGGNRNENNSRIDNRSRGNAPQLLEKYKNMARDAQLSGDRVMTEYYLQFADHYFRIVAESRARYEEQRKERDGWSEEGDEGYPDDRAPQQDGFEGETGDGEGDRDRERQPRRDRDYRNGNNNRNNRDREYRSNREPREERPRESYANGNVEADEEAPATLDVSVLPPSFASDGPLVPIDLDDEPEAAPAPRRRGRPRRVEPEIGEAAE